jgi:hypothetical protein
METGDCEGAFPRYWHNPGAGRCELFSYGGCGGNDNNFNTLADCERACPPANPCSALGDLGACEADAGCDWLAPACAEDSIPVAGCHDALPCIDDTACPEGTTCQSVSVDPCIDQPCNACAAPRNACLPPAPDACFDTALDPGGNCVHADGAGADPRCCAPYDCDPTQVACARIPPACPAGQEPTVVGLCWGPCVDAALCAPAGDPAERLCLGTGGRWDPGACGHYRCGQPNACNAIIPGCDCGAGKSFVEGQGCVGDPACGGAVGEPCDPFDSRCAPGLICLERGPESFCSEPGCAGDDECAPGLKCCYPCGIQGCVNQCIQPDANGECPLFP